MTAVPETTNTGTAGLNKTGKARMPEQDIAKGIAILLVIALHTLTLNQGAYYALGGIFGFIMPFFFFMAGYNHRPYRYTYRQIIAKRSRQILVPFFIYTLAITLIAGIYCVIAEGMPAGKIPDTYLTLLLRQPFAESIGITPYSNVHGCIMVGWFIEMLFSGSLIFYAVADYALLKPARLLSVLAGLIIATMVFAHFNIKLPFYIGEAPAIAAIMLIGALFGRQELLSEKGKKWAIIVNGITAYTLFILLALMFQGAGFMAGGSLWNSELKEWTVPLSVAYSVIGTYPFVHCCRCLKKAGFVSKALIWCGIHSMELLFFHGIVQLFVCSAFGLTPFRMSVHSSENDFRTFYVLAFEIAGSVLLIRLIEHCKKRMQDCRR